MIFRIKTWESLNNIPYGSVCRITQMPFRKHKTLDWFKSKPDKIGILIDSGLDRPYLPGTPCKAFTFEIEEQYERRLHD